MRTILFGDEMGLEIFENINFRNNEVCAVVCAEDRPAALEKAIELASKYKTVNMIHPLKSKKKEFDRFVDELMECNPDLILVNSYSRILPKEILEMPKLGCFNIHAGILPEYRGANIINWVLINGERESGVTIHKMTEIVDGGAVLLMKRIPISAEDTVLSLRGKLKGLAEEIIEEVIPLFEKNTITLYEQDEKTARCWPKRNPEDGFFDWDWDEEKIYNMIRALVHPWPGAFTYDNGHKKVYNRYLALSEIRKLKYAKNCSGPSA